MWHHQTTLKCGDGDRDGDGDDVDDDDDDGDVAVIRKLISEHKMN